MNSLATGWLVGVVQEKIGDFVDGLDQEMFSTSLWNGDVSISDLALKPSALDYLNLPVTVKAGTLGFLKIHLPWSRLAYEPVEVEINDIHLVANLNRWSRETQDEAAFNHKMSQVASRMEAVMQKVLESRKAEEGEGEQSQTWFAALLENIMDNIQVTVRKIHIRFEEDPALSNNPAQESGKDAAGVCIEEFTAYTCDKEERPYFSKEPAGWLKRTELKGQ